MNDKKILKKIVKIIDRWEKLNKTHGFNEIKYLLVDQEILETDRK